MFDTRVTPATEESVQLRDNTINARIDSIEVGGEKGDKGDTGDTGPTGPQGDTGDTGADGGGLAQVEDDLTPTLGGDLDMGGHQIVDGPRKLLMFALDPAAVNFLEIENAPTGSGPTMRAAGADNDVDLVIIAKRGGKIRLSSTVVLDGIIWPDVDGSSGQVLSTNGTGQASWVDQVAGGGSLQAQIDALTTRVTDLEAAIPEASELWVDGS